MKPDRSNYELWLIDWLDGNLDRNRTEQLMAFLNENPDLKEEADSLALTCITPENMPSMAKQQLKKTAAELPPSQIEFLSVAFLENDLSDALVKDLKENIAGNTENRRLFDSIQRTRLRPPDIQFKNKKLLRRRTLTQGIFRISAIGLSAAAAVAVLVLSYIFIPRLSETGNEDIAVNLITDTIFLRPGAVIIYKEEPVYERPYQTVSSSESTKIFKTGYVEVKDQPVAFMQEDPSELIERSPEILISAVPVYSDIEIYGEITSPSLIASNILVDEPLYYDIERSRLRRFVASVFRDKILKEEEYNDAPLEPYEFAEAGIATLNDLLGWEMALVKTSDEDGELKSFYFSSRILKFNAPVKKLSPSL